MSVRTRSESQLSADSVAKQRVASAESGALNGVRVPFLSGLARLLRCRKDLGQFAEVLGGGGEEEFVVCATWTAYPQCPFGLVIRQTKLGLLVAIFRLLPILCQRGCIAAHGNRAGSPKLSPRRVFRPCC